MGIFLRIEYADMSPYRILRLTAISMTVSCEKAHIIQPWTMWFMDSVSVPLSREWSMFKAYFDLN